jgi:hypothetical protein
MRDAVHEVVVSGDVDELRRLVLAFNLVADELIAALCFGLRSYSSANSNPTPPTRTSTTAS